MQIFCLSTAFEMAPQSPFKDFHPIQIILQIICLQCFWYLAMGTIWGLSHVIFDAPMSLDHFFTDQYINFTSFAGWSETLNMLLLCVAGAYLLQIIVEKAKKCVDFTFTLYFIHMWICTGYSAFPSTWQWWMCNIICGVIMAVIGEYWCAVQELKEIPSANYQRETREAMAYARKDDDFVYKGVF